MSVQCQAIDRQEPIEFYSYMTFDYTNKRKRRGDVLTRGEEKISVDKK